MQGFDAAPLVGSGDARFEVSAGLDGPGRVGDVLGAELAEAEETDALFLGVATQLLLAIRDGLLELGCEGLVVEILVDGRAGDLEGGDLRGGALLAEKDARAGDLDGAGACPGAGGGLAGVDFWAADAGGGIGGEWATGWGENRLRRPGWVADGALGRRIGVGVAVFW